MTKKKITALPTNAADWDAKTCLRFLARFENLIRKVPLAVRGRVYADCTDSMEAEIERAVVHEKAQKAGSVAAGITAEAAE
jgi:hypothetical protein